MASLLPRPRMLAASVVATLGAALFATQVGMKDGAWIPVGAVVIAAVALLVPRLIAQLLARGLLWANMLLGALIAILSGSSKMHYAAPLLLGCGVALLLGERRALAEASDARAERPVAFAGTLELLMILALGDAQTFGFFAWIDENGHNGRPFFIGASIGLLIGFVGLYRLAFWGVAVTMGTSALFAFGVLTRIIRVDSEVTVALLLLMALQLIVPLPMIASLVMRRPLPAPQRRRRALAGTVAVSAIMLLSLLIGATRR